MWSTDKARNSDTRYSVVVYMNDTEYFCRAYGPTEHIARLRAALICMAVNKTKPADEVGLTEGKPLHDE